jgi:D-arabinose 1-dehydrogenase-like Zn-dependent alcohol dehydrogenase
METMKAAVWKGDQGFDIEQVSKPLIEKNEILLKVKAVGVCREDLQMLAAADHVFTRF